MERKTLIILPHTFSTTERLIAVAVSKIAHSCGGTVCYTSAEHPSFEKLEERHQDRVRAVLGDGGKVYAFSACSDLTDMGVVNLGNIHLNAEKRVKAIFASAAE